MDDRTVGRCDFTSFAPGANDDGSGTVLVMEMARVMSQFNWESTIVLTTVTGEDEGLFGSTAYADFLAANEVDIAGMITNDVVGNIEGCVDPACPPGEPIIIDSLSVRHFSAPPSTSPSRQFARYMKLKGEQFLPEMTVNLIPAVDRPGRGGDHQPFLDNGYPGVRFTEPNEFGDGSGGNGRQHNEFDTVEFVNFPYLARITRINIAGIAALALAPGTPTGVQVFDAGNGSSALLTWPAVNTEPDLAGYRVAIRMQDGLFYSDIFDVGLEQEFLVLDLESDKLVYLSVSAYDTDFNESVFSEEVSIIPASAPKVPGEIEAQSFPTEITMQWRANTELDLSGYNLYRSTTSSTGFTLLAFVPAPTTSFFDNTAEPGTFYYYTITALDSTGFESAFSNEVKGRLATHDAGILVFDATRDGAGIVLQPTDEDVDLFYNRLLENFNLTRRWDRDDSTAVGIEVSDADLGIFSTLMVHADVPTAAPASDTSAIRKYVEAGGNLILSGWNLARALAVQTGKFNVFPSGTFVHDVLGVDSIATSEAGNRDFISAEPLTQDYPRLAIDSTKVPVFDHRLLGMDAFLPPFVDPAATEALHSYNSSLGPEFDLHGKPVSLRATRAPRSWLYLMFLFSSCEKWTQ